MATARKMEKSQIKQGDSDIDHRFSYPRNPRSKSVGLCHQFGRAAESRYD
jgi:hypothetical protein